MEKKPAANKAMEGGDENKAAPSRADRIAAAQTEMAEKLKDIDEADLHGAFEEARGFAAAINAEAARRGIALGTGAFGTAPAIDPEAGNFDGEFVATRRMDGDVRYEAGDPRSGKVSDFADLIRSGALAPKNAKTAAAASGFLGKDVAVYSASSTADEA